ncbi:PREDICTED: rRNA biogenesis protein RRP5-like [Camelina sativa]|uniref:rRNA biogenesis protein RRP5-like n=1 Tax=Camelina sativa TaxID=90675 RepID=A0ABM1QZJ9_CAMSA|nr:PREDICTED: rRNA biogenesis protein RRP5-like [Camelina sativa]
MDEKISDLQSSDITKSECNWVEKFSIGGLMKGTIQEQNELGVVVNFENINNVLGFIPLHHMGGATLVPGSVVNAVVLDLSRAERLVDLSLRPELINNLNKEVSNSQSKKKRKRGISKELEVHQRVSAVVEIVKEQYLVLSIPEYDYTIGYASVSDYNTQKLPVKQFSTGQSVVASVEAVQNPLSSGRLLLLLDSVSGTSETSRSKKAKKKSSCEVGSVVHAEITEIKPFELRVNFGHSLRGRIHITEVTDVSTSEEPFAKFRVGQSMSARVVAKPCHTDIKKSQLWELSVKPAMLRDSSELKDIQESEQLEFSAGQCVSGYVYKVDKEWVWLAISRNVTARLFILDTASEAHELEEFERRFPVGKAVSGYVLTYNKEKKTLRLVQRPLPDIHKSIANGVGSKMDNLDSSIPGDDGTLFIHEGDILGGRISKILPGVGGIRVQIGPYVFGRVHFTEINDSWVPNPLDGFREGQFVKCKVLEISSSSKGTWQIELSLRKSLDGMSSDHLSEDCSNNDNVCKRFERSEDLSPDMGVQGYVKNTMSKGCFIILSRTVEAKVLLSNLCDTFVKDPEKEFPVGKLPLYSSELKDIQESEQLEFSAGQCVSGYVYKVDKEWVWLAISRNVTARLFILDTASEAHELEEFERRFPVGKAVSGYVLTYNKEKKTLRLVQRPLPDIHKSIANGVGSKMDNLDSSIPGDDGTLFIHEGDILGGRISKILPGVGGIRVQIGPYVFGRVHFTEINDSWVPNPLDGFREGQFVKCKVLEISSSSKGTWQIELSLRKSLDGMSSDHLSEDCSNNDNVCKRFERSEDLSPDMGVQGYVKNTMSKGCFIILSRTVEAKVLLSNLCDTFVKDPEKEFPVGKLVTGRVLNVEPLSKRIEVTLKTVNAGGQPKSESYDLKKLRVGDMISGRIKRVEPYGLFITIGQTGMDGLCHKTQLSDDGIENIQARYKAGESVTAKILKLDEEKRRISLSMKSSYLMSGDDVDAQTPSEENANETNMECDPINDPKSEVLAAVGDFGFQETSGGKHSGTSVALAQVESRASIPPLEVDLDDIEETDIDNGQNHGKLQGADKDEKSKRREKQKDREEREKKIQAAEGRLLENHAPESADEFEKLVRSSPNSSFVWIKYMAFMLSLADIEKARSIAERALRTINIREEEERLNIWVAYFNLENEHGSPPEEAVKKVFERARQYCDPKKVYLALLGVYERTEQHKLADKLLDEMIKKFKQSCKVHAV